MKLKYLCSILLLCAVIDARAQTNTNIVDTVGVFEKFFQDASTNLMVAPYAIASADLKKYGAGIGFGYKLTENVVPTLRLDWYDSQFWMPSGNLQLQVPLHFGSVMVYPLAFTGVAAPIQGKASSDVVGIFGVGAAVQLAKHFDLIGDYEKWTGIGDQIRLGFVYKF